MPERFPLRPVVGVAVSFFLSLSLFAEEPAAVGRRVYEALIANDFDAVNARLAPGVKVPRMPLFKTMARARCLSLAGVLIDDAHVDGDQAVVRLSAALEKYEPVSGIDDIDIEHAILGMKRAGDGWQITSWTLAELKLIDELLAAKSNDDAARILMSHPELYGEPLTRHLRTTVTNAVNRNELEKGERIGFALFTLAGLTREEEVIYTANIAESMLTRKRTNGDLQAGVRAAEEAVAAAQRSRNPDTIGAAFYNLARSYEFVDGNTARGAPALRQAVDLNGRVIDEAIPERSAVLLSQYYIERGDHQKIFPLVDLAREIAMRTEDPFGLYGVQVILGNVFLQENDCELALPYFRKAAEIAAKLRFVGYIAMQQNIAHCAMLLGRKDDFQAATAEFLKNQNEQTYGAAAMLWCDIAADHLRSDEVKEADDAVREALKAADKAVENNIKAKAQEMLARVRLRQKRYAETLQAAENAIGEYKTGGDLSQLSVWLLAVRAHLARGERGAAYASLRSAMQYAEAERGSAAGSERQLALLFEPAAEAYTLLVDLLVEDGRKREAFLAAERAKARTLLDILEQTRSYAEADVPPAMLEEERKREKQLVDANIKGDRAAIEHARLELESYRTIVDANRPRLHAARGAGELASVASLATLLPDDSAIVEYVLGEKRLHIFVVRRGEKEPRVDVRSVPIAREELERLVTRYATALSSRDVAYAADVRRLHELLLAPVFRVAPGVRNVCIIPDGALWRVPFEPLMDANGTFAIEKRAFFYAPSAAVLLREHGRKAVTASKDQLFLGFGDPRIDIAYGDVVAAERGTSTAPIPEAAREVETIARIVGAKSSEVFTGRDALESRAKSEAPRYNIVHLATHGVLDDANPMYSRLLMSRREGDGEDGVLEAREMLELDLRADLVVLSACDTARGDVHAGEGLIGMSWALFAAGAPSVIASQWRVGSARTETLMTTFYDRWLKQPREPFAKARALRAARLALLRDAGYRHPYYWSAFVLIGSAD